MPTANVPPEFVNVSSKVNVTVGETLTLTLTASDENDDAITFEVVNIPDGASQSSSGSVLTFTWPVTSITNVSGPGSE